MLNILLLIYEVRVAWLTKGNRVLTMHYCALVSTSSWIYQEYQRGIAHIFMLHKVFVNYTVKYILSELEQLLVIFKQCFLKMVAMLTGDR